MNLDLFELLACPADETHPLELRAAVSTANRLERISLPKTYRLVKALGRRNVGWDRFWRRFRAAHVNGGLLLAICKRRPS